MSMGLDRPDWTQDGRTWPNRSASRFVQAGGIRWHVQIAGQGPVLLLLHGTGAATHSWRDVFPLLARHFTVVAPDLPGHGFTERGDAINLSLQGMASAVANLMRVLKLAPVVSVGHSAGAAVLVEMSLSERSAPAGIIAINGALLPMRGNRLFAPLARALFLNPLAPRLFAWRARSPLATRRLLEGTGSNIDEVGLAHYERLFSRPGHVAATLGMMANWGLDQLQVRLSKLLIPLVLVTALDDLAVPPNDARRLALIVPTGRVVELRRGGHLAHEMFPRRIAALVLREARRAGVTRRVHEFVNQKELN